MSTEPLRGSTVLPVPTTKSVASQAKSTESLSMSTELTITSEPVTSTARADVVEIIPPEIGPSFQPLRCTLASVLSCLHTCFPPQPGTDTNCALATEVTSTLLDGSHGTCMRPFQFSSLLMMSFDTADTQGSSLIHIQITGDGLDCVQPSTLVYVDLLDAVSGMTISNKINKQECPFMKNSHNTGLVTCTYECRPFPSCQGPMRFGVQVKRLSWLAQSQSLEQLCDIQTLVWIWQFFVPQLIIHGMDQ